MSRSVDSLEPAQAEVRLSGWEWLGVGVAAATVLAVLPRLWARIEPDRPDCRYRIAYDLGDDYWQFQRQAARACGQGRVPVLGDSVVWGHFAPPTETLPEHLNRLAGQEEFANLGVDGIHPAAMAGLIEHYGSAIGGRSVILHCNLLWMSSPRHDLQEAKEPSFNHPRLVPQFSPGIHCYADAVPVGERLANVVRRNLPAAAWSDHLRLAYFERRDIPRWTLEHPYENPLRVLASHPAVRASPDEASASAPSWEARKMTRFHAPWVELDGSFQWRMFREAIETLRRRGNRIFVVVGPFNEHMLTEESRLVYAERRRQVERWLKAQGLSCYAPAALPSDLYADASHPLASGYEILARRLWEDESFAAFCGRAAAPDKGADR